MCVTHDYMTMRQNINGAYYYVIYSLQGKCDIKVWMNAAKATQVDKVKEVFLKSSNEIIADLSDIILVSESLLPGKV